MLEHFAALSLALVTLGAYAQAGSDAIVVGLVTDSGKAAISGATVALTQVATQTTYQVKTDERGQYRTPPLRIGEYIVTVESPASGSGDRLVSL